jgi:uncharacterized protein YkwD
MPNLTRDTIEQASTWTPRRRGSRGAAAPTRAILAIGLLALASAPRPAQAGALDDAVLAELNFARAHPADYARTLRDDGRPEDPSALREAIGFLARQPPLPPLSPDAGLEALARDHADAQGPLGQTGHVDPDGAGFAQRLHRHSLRPRAAGEDIAYGYATPRDVVRQLIVDSGVPDRGHRRNIFDPGFRVAGVGCGRHRVYRVMCVIDFASAPPAR